MGNSRRITFLFYIRPDLAGSSATATLRPAPLNDFQRCWFRKSLRPHPSPHLNKPVRPPRVHAGTLDENEIDGPKNQNDRTQRRNLQKIVRQDIVKSVQMASEPEEDRDDPIMGEVNGVTHTPDRRDPWSPKDPVSNPTIKSSQIGSHNQHREHRVCDPPGTQIENESPGYNSSDVPQEIPPNLVKIPGAADRKAGIPPENTGCRKQWSVAERGLHASAVFLARSLRPAAVPAAMLSS